MWEARLAAIMYRMIGMLKRGCGYFFLRPSRTGGSRKNPHGWVHGVSQKEIPVAPRPDGTDSNRRETRLPQLSHSSPTVLPQHFHRPTGPIFALLICVICVICGETALKPFSPPKCSEESPRSAATGWYKHQSPRDAPPTDLPAPLLFA